MSAVLVMGAASGIGLATAQLFAQQGWQVAGLDRVAIPDGTCTWSAQVDVRDESALRAAVHDAVTSLKRLDALVCAAGISGSAAGDGPVHESSGAAFDDVIGVNLRGTFLTVSAAWRALVATSGAIVTVSSVLGLTGGGGPFRSHAYVAAKGGLIALTRALAAEGRPASVRVNCVAPGLVDTPFAGRAVSDPAIAAYVAQRQPLVGGPIEPADVAAAIAYLCSDAAVAITGQILSLDAGWRLDPT